MSETELFLIDADLPFVLDVDNARLVAQSPKKSIPRGRGGSEIFSFEFPRCLEGHDVMLCDLITVHYTNTDAKTKTTSVGFDKCGNVAPTEDGLKVRFTWKIGGGAVKYVGGLSFSVQLRRHDDETNVIYEYNTHSYTKVSVGASEDHGDDVLENYPPDIIMTWDNAVNDAVERANALRSPTVEIRDVDGGHELIFTDNETIETLTILDGAPFKYEDFTPEQLAALIGPQGPEGPSVVEAKLIGEPGEEARFVALVGAEITEVTDG